MQRIQDGRREIMIHDNASVDDVPVDGLPELPPVTETASFVPANMSEPRLYPGDVVVGVEDGRVSFAELIYDTTEEGVVVVSLGDGYHSVIKNEIFSRRFFGADEIHIYDDVHNDTPEWDTEFNESQITRPEPSRAR